MKFYAFLTATVVVISPGICLMWVFLAAGINWHDALDVAVLVAVVWMVRDIRRQDRAAERAIRRITARRWSRHETASSMPRDWYSYASGPVGADEDIVA